MEQYPVFLTITDRKCLVVGAGTEARRRVRGLANSGALVTVVATNATAPIEGAMSLESREFEPQDLEGCWLVMAASDDQALNQHIANLCQMRQILCKVRGDQKNSSSFQIPSIVDRSPLIIAIGSGGASPILARALKTKLETLIPNAYALLATSVGKLRHQVKEKLPSKAARAQFWHGLINGPIGELAFSANTEQLEQSMRAAIDSIDQSKFSRNHVGHVALVGAGPGDADLLTFRALRLIQSADVIVHDRLVSRTILNLCRTDVELIYAGKAKANHAIPQHSINQLLVDLARQGKNVVRLKGGDPFIFGRGGEEIETLAQHDISFQVVPGITAASGCASFSGIPLTHRDHAQSCVFITGHLKNQEINLNWQDLQDPSQTIVVYMGLTGLATICASLVEHGRDPMTPAALIEHGTTPKQRVLAGNLKTLPDIVEKNSVSAPTLLIIGGVVELRHKLKWFEGVPGSESTFR